MTKEALKSQPKDDFENYKNLPPHFPNTGTVMSNTVLNIPLKNTTTCFSIVDMTCKLY